MKKIIRYFRDFHKEYYHTKMYVFITLFIVTLITINYLFDIENSYIDRYYGKPIRILFYFCYHAQAYFGVLLIIYFFGRGKLLLSSEFWIKSIFGFLILSVDRSVFPYIAEVLKNFVPSQIFRFCRELVYNVYGFITILGMLAIMKCMFDRREDFGIYGLRFRKVNYRIYFLMFLAVSPLVLIASFTPDFIDYYPTYKGTGGVHFANYYQFSEKISMFLYETVYLSSFLNTEVFFRGFLVIGLSRLLGKNVVLPMTAAYAVLHFGKPMGEAISSVFGGYILGIIALYSRNIWGGVFIHGGIAFLMEVLAFIRQ
jgi:hypothetical protein